jgi:NADPH:quinone reductase-like Zn-dependent oxidoreductase
MKTLTLIRTGTADKAFEMREAEKPSPDPGQVLIKVEGFGLNFADVIARHGKYKDAPPLPAVLGYEVVGRIETVGKNVSHLLPGQRVTAFTRFGGYAEFAVTDTRAVARIPDDMDAGVAVALATQYCTAWFCTEEMIHLHPGDHVLIHAAAGGVGTALTQLCKRKGCVVFGTGGSEEKLAYIRANGADHAINYTTQDFAAEIRKVSDRPIDVVFDSAGGKTFRKGKSLLGAGGRIIGYGAAEQLEKKTIFGSIRLLFDFGFTNPVFLLMASKSIIGVNMLRVSDQRPDILQRCLQNVVALATVKEILPHVGGRFKATEIGEAHAFLESRKSTGKILVTW